MPDLAVRHKLGHLGTNNRSATTRAAGITQIATKLEGEGGKAVQTHTLLLLSIRLADVVEVYGVCGKPTTPA